MWFLDIFTCPVSAFICGHLVEGFGLKRHCAAGPRNFRALNSPHSIIDLRSISFRYSGSRLPTGGSANLRDSGGPRYSNASPFLIKGNPSWFVRSGREVTANSSSAGG